MPLNRAERERLLLLCAGTASRRRERRDELRELCAGVAWASLGSSLEARRLMPTLGPRLVAIGGTAVPASFSERCEAALAAARRRGEFLELTCERVSDVLKARGIRSVPLKGPALARAAYGDVGRRLCADIDLLVHARDLDCAVKSASTLGYEPPRDHVDGAGLPRLHLTLVHPAALLPTLELHWRIHWYERAFAAERLLGRATYADELASLLLFYARDGFAGLRLAADIAAWWDRYGGSLEESALSEVRESYPALAPALAAAALAAQRVVGVPAVKLLGAKAPRRPRARLAARLADPHPARGASQLYADMGVVDGLLSPWSGLPAFVRRQLLLPRGVIDERIRSAGSPSTSALGYLARSAVRWGVLGRYALTLGRALRPARTPTPAGEP